MTPIEQNSKIITLVAEEAEEEMVKKFLPQTTCIRTGVGASNVIKTLCQLPSNTKVVNIGYAGSNLLPIGTVTYVKSSYRLMNDTYQFHDYNNPLTLSKQGYPCYTSNSFVTEATNMAPTLYDMELNYMVAFPLHFLGAIKIVSDNLSVDAFQNNAIRSSGVLTSEKVWQEVAKMFTTFEI